MATLNPARLILFLLTAAFAALLAVACSGEEDETVTVNPGTNTATGLTATVYASPT